MPSSLLLHPVKDTGIHHLSYSSAFQQESSLNPQGFSERLGLQMQVIVSLARLVLSASEWGLGGAEGSKPLILLSCLEQPANILSHLGAPANSYFIGIQTLFLKKSE